ncbi:hypothetical protein [Desulfosporosinus sp.]|uniref:hypothetical protein n=1 Tax=Desulfosporosinus sp. TaxID=157907 RepID=UPI0025C4D280|nr:hypothetical protein [Desulfosporosinus sp.]MBC2723349.1 hypothetical protein [Desulfosporosinus sp.]MBC2725172.1 hypothetical protein [Desulfosporosinus sp.]
MKKIKDRYFLTVVAGLLGLVGVTVFDTLSYRMGYSERTYRETAAGLFVPSKRKAKTKSAHILGLSMNGVASIIGAGLISTLFVKTGRDFYALKGMVSGITHGAFLMLIQSFLPWNKMKPKGPVSNLSYVLTNAFYGLICGTAIAKLGDDSLFDVEPVNDQLKPTIETSEEVDRRFSGYTDIDTTTTIGSTYH